MFTRLEYIHQMIIVRKGIHNMKTTWQDLYDEEDIKGQEEKYKAMKENFNNGIYSEV